MKWGGVWVGLPAWASEVTGHGQPLLLLTIETHLTLLPFEDLQCASAPFRVLNNPPGKAVLLDHSTPATRLLLFIVHSRF